MVNKELKRMKRADLLDILLKQNREIERLQQELKIANQKLADRQIEIKTCGSIAEASLVLNGVFETAQAACQQYIENVKQRSEQQERICTEMERRTKEKCEQMIQEAQCQADVYRELASQKVQQVQQKSENPKAPLPLE